MEVDDLYKLQRLVAPELIEVIRTRHDILRAVLTWGPVGRRSLTGLLGINERGLRSQMDFLKEQGLLNQDLRGVTLTQEGEDLLDRLNEYIIGLKGGERLAEELRSEFNLEKVIIVPDDSGRQLGTKRHLGRAAARILRRVLEDPRLGFTDRLVLAVSGGTTMAEVARAATPLAITRELTVVPARGGLGEEIEIQANTIAVELARRLGAGYRLLHLPDNLSEESALALAQDPHLQEILDLIRSAQILVHGIGMAEEMARRRGISTREIEELRRRGALGEAFGYYFSQMGEVVQAVPSAGLRFEDLPEISLRMAVAGGAGKASAIRSVLLAGRHHFLVTDEGAARRMRELREGFPGKNLPPEPA
ncbi:MAG: hypothetical protein M1299_06075 [Firmicutes bacterium]|nr:hypothetical protein [Bacillota bacterium]MCL5039377.1 hypothetical protein [Bacillota bacterium]